MVTHKKAEAFVGTTPAAPVEAVVPVEIDAIEDPIES